MKKTMLVLLVVVVTAAAARGQGQIFVGNPQAQTRIGSIDGPFAGLGIWGQMLAGPAPDNLVPVGLPDEHNPIGGIVGGIATVPNVRCGDLGYAQLVVWDGRLWGTVFENVPADQRGATDIVPEYMNCFPVPIYAPFFTRPAVVPVPEPSALVLVGVGILVVALRMRHWPRSG